MRRTSGAGGPAVRSGACAGRHCSGRRGASHRERDGAAIGGATSGPASTRVTGRERPRASAPGRSGQHDVQAVAVGCSWRRGSRLRGPVLRARRRAVVRVAAPARVVRRSATQHAALPARASSARTARRTPPATPACPTGPPPARRWRARLVCAPTDRVYRPPRRRHASPQRAARRSRSALPITDTELNVIAALAMIGLSSRPKSGIEHPGRDRHAEHVVDEREEQVLADVAHRRAAQPARADEAREGRPSPA